MQPTEPIPATAACKLRSLWDLFVRSLLRNMLRAVCVYFFIVYCGVAIESWNHKGGGTVKVGGDHFNPMNGFEPPGDPVGPHKEWKNEADYKFHQYLTVAYAWFFCIWGFFGVPNALCDVVPHKIWWELENGYFEIFTGRKVIRHPDGHKEYWPPFKDNSR